MSQNMNEDLNVIANSDLEITYLDGDLAIIQQLDDEPNDVGGLTSAQLKAKFDQAGLAIQSYLNNTLIPELLAADATEAAREAAEAGRQAAEQTRVTAETARAAAEQERVNTTSGIVAQATQKAQEAAASAVRAEQVALGNIPDGSLAKAKLVQEVQNALDRAAPGGEIDTLLSGKAPGGHGLGKTGVNVPPFSNADLMKTFGVYRGVVAFTTDTISFSYNGTLLVIPGIDVIVQHFYPSTSAFGTSTGHITRYSKDGGATWQPWEWVNPPMQIGVEYRTTERYLGKPVYVKAVDFGALPNSGDKIVSIEAENSNIVAIRCCGVLNNGVNIPGVDVNDSSSANPIQCWAVSASIWIAVPYDASHRTAVVTVWYYKTTG